MHRPYQPWPKETIQSWLKLKKKGLTCGQIAEITGETRNTIIGALWRYEKKLKQK